MVKVDKHKARQWAAACHKTQVINLHHNKPRLRKINMRQRLKQHLLTKRQLSNNMLRQHLLSSNMDSNKLNHNKVVMRLSHKPLQRLLIKRQQHRHSVQRHNHSKTSPQIWMMIWMTIFRSDPFSVFDVLFLVE